jgi:membrane-bound serine protease (ClpP class)
VFGSMILVDSPMPELQVSLRVVVPTVLGCAAVAIFLVRLAVTAQRQPAATGVAAMIGEPGVALTAIDSHRLGRVSTHGEIWQARAADPIPEGARVRTIGVDGLTLDVRKD